MAYCRFEGGIYRTMRYNPLKEWGLTHQHYPNNNTHWRVPFAFKDDIEWISYEEFMKTKTYNIEYNGELRTRADSSRALLDVGNLPIDYASVYSGTAVTLSGDGKITLPTTGTSYAFDHKTKTFVVVTTELKDGTFGTIIKLDTNTFSQADLTAFTARPELVLEWVNGTAIPSGIVKGAKDEIVVPTITGTHTTTNTSQFGIQSITQGAGNINGGADGRYITLPLTQPKDYLVTKCIDSIKGDNKEVIVYNCDGTTETIKA